MNPLKEKVWLNSELNVANPGDHIDINISTLKRTLFYIFLFLLALNLTGILLTQYNHVKLYGLGKFYFDREDSFPTYFSSIILLFSAILLVIITALKTQIKDSYSRHWLILSIIFMAMSIDEIAGIHETLIDPIRFAFNLTGYLRFSWVIPGMIFIIFLSFFYLKFLTSLSKSYRNDFILSGSIYVAGAIGFEMIGANLYEGGLEQKNLFYNLIMTIEESMEMAGILLFISSLLSYLQSLTTKIRLNLM